MDEQQSRIKEDLRDIVTTGDILTDELARAAYSTDASILQVQPLAVVIPKTVDELAGIVQYAAERGLHLHPRGAGTGLAGESLGPGLVVDTCRYLTQINDTESGRVRVQPGVCWQTLQAHLAKSGRMFAPDPVSGDRCTIGGMLGTDAAGPHSLRYGTTANHVHRLKIVLADGRLADVGSEPIGSGADDELQPVVNGVAEIVGAYATDIVREQSVRLIKPGGYRLAGLIRDHSIDLPRLLVGSEGTLAMFAEAELTTVSIPSHRGRLLACFRSLESAVTAALECLEFHPSACEMLDRRLLTLAREDHPLYRQWVPESAEALLLLDEEGNDAEQIRGWLRQVVALLSKRKGLAADPVRIEHEPELSLCWAMRQCAIPRLTRSAGSVQPVAFVENTAVPPAKLPRFLKRVQDIMKHHGVTASFNAHIGVGVLHTRPLLDVRRPDHVAKLEAISYQILEAVIEAGGTNHGEHGSGLLRSGLIHRQFPRLYPAFRKIKALFDPKGIFNPGRIVDAESSFPRQHLRITAAPVTPAPVTITPKLRWPGLSMLETAQHCNGCGVCRSVTPRMHMCPTFKALGTELAAPRAKANLIRQIGLGQLDPKLLSSDQLREVADLCVHCKMCMVECPAGVDICKLMLEAKAANVADNGLSWGDWFFCNLDDWSQWASNNAAFINRLLDSRVFRWLAEKTFDVSRRRPVPKFHHRTFLRRAVEFGWTHKPRGKGPKVAFLADTFVNHNDPDLGEHAIRVMQHLGRKVYVPPLQGASGMAPLVHGDLDTARLCIQRNIEAFAGLARDGYDIVSTEPSAVLMFREEAAGVIEDRDLDRLAEQTYELSEYLAVLAERGQLRDDFQPVPWSVAYHEPCHERALRPRGAVRTALERIPELRLQPVELGCCGMAGTFGFRTEGHDVAQRAGLPLFERLAGRDVQAGITQASTCRMHLEQGTGKRVLHPVYWFAMAYGLVADPNRLLARPNQGGLNQ